MRPLTSGKEAPASGETGWFARWYQSIRTLRRSAPDHAGVDADPLMAFAAEDSVPPSDAEATSRRPSLVAPRARMPIAIAALVVITAVGIFAASRMLPVPTFTAGTEPGRLRVETQPAGAAVLINGSPRGVTPLALSLDPGAYTMTVRAEGDEREIALTVAPGADVARYFEMKASTPPVPAGQMSIVTDPPGARVSVDGRTAGTSPLTVENLGTGDHNVIVTNNLGSAEGTVRVTPGTVASVVFTLPKTAAPTAGWLSVKAPFDVQILEGTDVIGTGDMTKVMLAAGRHDIILTSRPLDYSEIRRIVVTAGTVTAVIIDPPSANLNANARPWADVTIDGRSVGQTPIANLPVPIGTHEVVFRHPQLGERRQTVTITAKGLNRVSVDLTK